MIRFRSLWTIDVRHAFFGGAAPLLEFIVPPATQRALAGARAIARERNGVLHVLIELDDAQQPMSPLAGRQFVFGLRPREAAFDTYTAPLGVARGESVLWANSASPHALDPPRGVRLIRPPRIGEPVAPPDTVFIEPDLAAQGAWGLLVLTVDAAHVADGHAFHLDFAVRSETLRYYVVAGPSFSQNEFDQVTVLDTGFATEGRPQIVFDKLLPAAFGAQHLQPALLDPSGSARVACFQAQAPVARRPRGPGRLELHRNGDVLIGNLPQPGATRHDAQFVVHLSKP